MENLNIEQLKEKYNVKTNNDLRIKAQRLANLGQIDEAIYILSFMASKGDDNAMCDLGVTYEKKGDYQKALECALKSKALLAKENACKLLRHHLPFDYDLFMGCVEELKRHSDERGWIQLNLLYNSENLGYLDRKKGYEAILDGIRRCGNTTSLLFELGYALESGNGVEEDPYKSHLVYRSGLNLGLKLEDVSNVLHYNYALQCYQGRGCEKDLKEALLYFTHSARNDYKSAIEYLVEIYTEVEKDEKKASLYLKKLEGKPLTQEEKDEEFYWFYSLLPEGRLKEEYRKFHELIKSWRENYNDSSKS